jgi:hypothetical protein
MTRPQREMGSDIRWGISGAMFIAGVYSAWVMAVYVFRGSEPFSRVGMTLPLVVVTYLAVGFVAGLIVGLLRPLTRWKAGAYVVGLVAALFGGAGIVAALRGPPTTWDFDEWLVLPIVALGAAWVIGSELWKHRDTAQGVAPRCR